MRMTATGFSSRISPAPLLAIVGLVAVSALGGCGSETPGTNTAASAEKASGGGDGKGIKQGDKAPQFAIDSMNGTGKMTIAPGKVTIVDFPKLQELYVKYKTNGLEIVAVSVDDEKGGITDFAKTHGAKFPVGWDDGKKLAEKWKPETMPSSYIIGKDGVVKHVHRGYHEGEENEVEKELKALF
jgi:cytochrome c biogenesis protein CcmG/thiol:disulfide interchange protein DsbE